MTTITINNKKITIDVLEAQNFKNLTIVPLATDLDTSEDILTLKKGIGLGLVTIEELNDGVVPLVKVNNNAVTPLILVDGEEIKGAKQNRIISGTVLIHPKTTTNVNVCCSEAGRWHYNEKHGELEEFGFSDCVAAHSVRQEMNYCKNNNYDAQQAVWNSIEKLSNKNKVYSDTRALRANYETNHVQIKEALSNFKRLDNQSGIIAILNNEIIGCEFFATSRLYKEYHENLVKSHIIEAFANCKEDNKKDMGKEINLFLNGMSDCYFKEEKTSESLGELVSFTNEEFAGQSRVYNGCNIHTSYFKNPTKNIKN